MLAYWHALQVGEIAFTSQEAGVTCKADDGRGFSLSKKRYDLHGHPSAPDPSVSPSPGVERQGVGDQMEWSYRRRVVGSGDAW